MPDALDLGWECFSSGPCKSEALRLNTPQYTSYTYNACILNRWLRHSEVCLRKRTVHVRNGKFEQILEILSHCYRHPSLPEDSFSMLYQRVLMETTAVL